jgi:hypothetical protein
MDKQFKTLDYKIRNTKIKLKLNLQIEYINNILKLYLLSLFTFLSMINV